VNGEAEELFGTKLFEIDQESVNMVAKLTPWWKRFWKRAKINDDEDVTPVVADDEMKTTVKRNYNTQPKYAKRSSGINFTEYKGSNKKQQWNMPQLHSGIKRIQQLQRVEKISWMVIILETVNV